MEERYVILLLNKVIKSLKVENYNKYLLYKNLKVKKNVIVGRTVKGNIKRMYLHKLEDNTAEILEGIEYNQFQVSVYKKITVSL